jgi:hypothetical protein
VETAFANNQLVCANATRVSLARTVPFLVLLESGFLLRAISTALRTASAKMVASVTELASAQLDTSALSAKHFAIVFTELVTPRLLAETSASALRAPTSQALAAIPAIRRCDCSAISVIKLV